MAKIHSNYLKADFEVLTYDGSNGEVIIPHDALVDIVHNQIPTKLSCKYEIADVLVSDTHNVFKCTFSDNMGRRVQEIGESVSTTLTSAISQDYPALMAFQRAFDRAAIKYLAFPGKVYSNMEGVATTAPAETTTVVDVAAVAKEAEAPAAAPIETAPVEERKEPAPSPAPISTDLGKTLYNIGKYKANPKPLEELYESDKNALVWMRDTYSGQSEAGKALKAACTDYLKQRGE